VVTIIRKAVYPVSAVFTGAATILCLLALGGCTAGAGSSSSTSLRTVATFQSSGDGETARFVTNGDWALAWSCNPDVVGAPAPYSLTIHDETPDNSFFGLGVLDTVCAAGATQGTVGVRQSGEQWLRIGTGGRDGPWTLTVEVTASDTSAALLPTPLPTATSLPPTPLPTSVPLPLTFSGSGDQAIANALPFSIAVSWYLRASCQGHPDVVADVNIYQFGLPGAFSPSDGIQVGSIEFPCDGRTADTNQDHPNGFPSGTYAIEVVSNGNWTITVEQK
jgi:hypothetical protein